MTDAQFLDRLATLKRLGILAGAGVIVLILALLAPPEATATQSIVGSTSAPI